MIKTKHLEGFHLVKAELLPLPLGAPKCVCIDSIHGLRVIQRLLCQIMIDYSISEQGNNTLTTLH